MRNCLTYQIRTRLAFVFAVFLSSIILAPPTSVIAADRPLQKINVAYSSISGNVSPLWITQDKGFFRKYGLDVQAILIESGTTTAQALVAGDISFASVAGPAAIQSNLRGADVVNDCGSNQYFDLSALYGKGHYPSRPVQRQSRGGDALWLSHRFRYALCPR
jgi:ABC-type nitrate/sulfonate/bicarbonate transport system substrate-binding protein